MVLRNMCVLVLWTTVYDGGVVNGRIKKEIHCFSKNSSKICDKIFKHFSSVFGKNSGNIFCRFQKKQRKNYI